MIHKIFICNPFLFFFRLPSPKEFETNFKETFIDSLEEVLESIKDEHELGAKSSGGAKAGRMEKRKSRESHYFGKCSHIFKLQLDVSKHCKMIN